MNRETMVIAHRGASALAPHENTLEAFQIAIDLKADMAEFDVRKTSDNILIVFHDGTIDGRKIGDMTYNRINDITSAEPAIPDSKAIQPAFLPITSKSIIL